MNVRYKYKVLCLIWLSSGFVAGLTNSNIYAQKVSSSDIWNKIVLIENTDDISLGEKLFECQKLKQTFEENGMRQDSVYARLLHRTAAFQYQLNNMVATQEVMDNTIKSLQINNSGGKACSPYFAINSYSNLAIYYNSVSLYKKAYEYYDSAIINNEKKGLNNPIAEVCYVNIGSLDLRLGDYQKCIEDCILGIAMARRRGRIDILTELLNQRAQAYLYLKKTNLVLGDIDSARRYALLMNDEYELATETKTRALLMAQLEKYDESLLLFSKSIQHRIATGSLVQIADDYTDLGNFYLKRKDYNNAIKSYNKTLLYAIKAKDAERKSKGYINLGEVASSKGNYNQTARCYQKSLEVFGINEKSILKNPSLQSLSSIGNTDLLFGMIGNKVELLLRLYKSNHEKQYLDACIQAGLLMDSAISQARHLQTGENSKLYWRNETRRFFVNILEACFWADDADHCFYFMEKSRAVLLNDNLNESAASIHLPAKESVKEQEFKFRLIEAKMQMNNLDIHQNEYYKAQLKFLQVKDEFEGFVKTLEQKYPAYYKYKYDDEVPSLQALQERLLKNKETFIHYFTEDSVLYVLAANGKTAKMTRYAGPQFQENDFRNLLSYCADRSKLNNHYPDFAMLAHKLYNVLFKGLNIEPGRVIVSQDNLLIPFEILCRDTEGKNYLLYDYTFSYVYSASFLLKKITSRAANADFIGFAPVAFKPVLKLPNLENAAIALKKSAAHYSNITLLENNKADRKAFLSKIADYNVVSVFSHAFADTVSNEPVLYMQDSVVSLSELQLLNNPATQLVILSACQTNVGRNETGEGIYSLARGFASAGIPAVSATLWKADENVIYIISDKFNEYLSKGYRKDEALRLAKLAFIEGPEREKLLPYYWANMVLIGKADPVYLLSSSNHKILWWLAAGFVTMLLIFTGKRYLNKQSKISYEKK